MFISTGWTGCILTPSFQPAKTSGPHLPLCIPQARRMHYQDGCAASLPALHSNPMSLGVGAGRRDRGRHEVGHAKIRPCRAWTVARPPIWQRAVQPTVSAMGTNETGQGSWLRFPLGIFSCLNIVFTQVKMMILHKCLCFSLILSAWNKLFSFL